MRRPTPRCGSPSAGLSPHRPVCQVASAWLAAPAGTECPIRLTTREQGPSLFQHDSSPLAFRGGQGCSKVALLCRRTDVLAH